MLCSARAVDFFISRRACAAFCWNWASGSCPLDLRVFCLRWQEKRCVEFACLKFLLGAGLAQLFVWFL